VVAHDDRFNVLVSHKAVGCDLAITAIPYTTLNTLSVPHTDFTATTA